MSAIESSAEHRPASASTLRVRRHRERRREGLCLFTVEVPEAKTGSIRSALAGSELVGYGTSPTWPDVCRSEAQRR